MWVPAGVVYVAAGPALLALRIRHSGSRASLPIITVLAACSFSCRSKLQKAAEITGGNDEQGKAKIAYYGCGFCHDITGVSGADGLVGPLL